MDPALGKAVVHFVIFHWPGPVWNSKLSPLEQPGVGDHRDYMLQIMARGDVDLGGPFLDAGGGGMAITRAGMTEAEAVALCEADPGIRSGLITFELRKWLKTLDAPAG
jgi:uncharacterized protein YciI